MEVTIHIRYAYYNNRTKQMFWVKEILQEEKMINCDHIERDEIFDIYNERYLVNKE